MIQKLREDHPVATTVAGTGLVIAGGAVLGPAMVIGGLNAVGFTSSGIAAGLSRRSFFFIEVNLIICIHQVPLPRVYNLHFTAEQRQGFSPSANRLVQLPLHLPLELRSQALAACWLERV